MSNNLGRPKKSSNLRVVTINMEQQMVDLIDSLAQEQGISRSEMARGMLDMGFRIQGLEPHVSMIILKETEEGVWVGFDPEIGRNACYGLGEDPEEALAHFFNEEEDFIEQLNKQALENTSD